MESKSIVKRLLGALVLTAMLPMHSQAVQIFVGYADNLRPTGFFPNPWSGDPSVGLFAGGGSSFDAGAVMVRNDGASAITIDSIVVTLNPSAGPATFNLWSAFLPFVLDAGKNAIFTQTGSFNFDTTDFPIVSQDLANNCSIGAKAATALCVDNAPKIDLSLDGVLGTLTDTKHVLNGGGFDTVCCLPNGNESLRWRLIGTTGVENPGGGGTAIPEPASLLLLATGILGFAGLRRPRHG